MDQNSLHRDHTLTLTITTQLLAIPEFQVVEAGLVPNDR